MSRDLQDLIRGVVAYGPDALLEGPWRQNHQETTGLIRPGRRPCWAPLGTVTLVNGHFLSKSSVVLFSFVHEVSKDPQPRPCGARLITRQCAEAD
jgi:hypothetical protein